MHYLPPQGEKGDMGLPGPPGGDGTKVGAAKVYCVNKEINIKSAKANNDNTDSYCDISGWAVAAMIKQQPVFMTLLYQQLQERRRGYSGPERTHANIQTLHYKHLHHFDKY